MSSAWAKAWGSSWGGAWGAVKKQQQAPGPDDDDFGQKHFERLRLKRLQADDDEVVACLVLALGYAMNRS